MGTQGKVVATAIIWAAFTLIMIYADVDTNNFINLAILAGAAMISTVAVWDGMNNQRSSSKQQIESRGNAQFEKGQTQGKQPTGAPDRFDERRRNCRARIDPFFPS